VASPRTYLEVWKLLLLGVGDGIGDLACSDALVYLSLQCLVGVWCGQEIEHDAPDSCRRVIRATSDLDHGFNLALTLAQTVTNKRTLRETTLVAFPTVLQAHARTSMSLWSSISTFSANLFLTASCAHLLFVSGLKNATQETAKRTV
jgi:hypothetical protein